MCCVLTSVLLSKFQNDSEVAGVASRRPALLGHMSDRLLACPGHARPVCGERSFLGLAGWRRILEAAQVTWLRI